MPLRYADSLDHQTDAIRAQVERIRGRDLVAPPPRAGTAEYVVRVDSPHLVFDLGVSDIAAGRGLDAARATTVRYLVSGPSGILAAGEFGPSAVDAAVPVVSVNFGPFVDGTVAALADVEGLLAAQPNLYEVRLLRCGALFVAALWLVKSDSSDGSLLYPQTPVPAFLPSRRLYSPAMFLDALRAPASALVTTTNESNGS